MAKPDWHEMRCRCERCRPDLWQAVEQDRGLQFIRTYAPQLQEQYEDWVAATEEDNDA